jgi:hypothetical protein
MFILTEETGHACLQEGRPDETMQTQPTNDLGAVENKIGQKKARFGIVMENPQKVAANSKVFV